MYAVDAKVSGTGVIQFSKMKNFDAKNFSTFIRENYLYKIVTTQIFYHATLS
jgi:hypothetical protein